MEWAFAGAVNAARTGSAAARRRRRSRRMAPRSSRRCSGTSRRCTASRARWASAPTRSASTSSTHYDGDAEAVWSGDVPTGDELLRRLQRAARLRRREVQDLHRLLAKRLGVQPAGLGGGGRPVRRRRAPSVADIDSPESLRPGPRVEEGQEEGRQDQAGLTSPGPGGLTAGPQPGSGFTCGAWRSSQPSSTATARGSWRSWWPAPAMMRSSAAPWASAEDAGVEVRAPPRRRRRARRAAAGRRGRATAVDGRMVAELAGPASSDAGKPGRGDQADLAGVLEERGGGGRPSRRSRPARRARRRPGPRGSRRAGADGQRAAGAEAGQPHRPHPVAPSRRWSIAAWRSSSHPASEKSPSDCAAPPEGERQHHPPQLGGDAVGQLRERRGGAAARRCRSGTRGTARAPGTLAGRAWWAGRGAPASATARGDERAPPPTGRSRCSRRRSGSTPRRPDGRTTWHGW